MKHETFSFGTQVDLEKKLQEIGVSLPLSNDHSLLKQPVSAGSHLIPNRICIQPMEGSDGKEDNSPSDLTRRRYMRFAKGGAGLIWFEAVSVVSEGRASPRQLYLSEKNSDSFARLVEEIKAESVKNCGVEPVVIVQAAHSGRYSKPEGPPAPIIAYNNRAFEGDTPIPAERIISDDALQALEEEYGRFAALCERIGFDGVDVKACHRYLASELLSAYTRPGRYGGSFENRIRFLTNCLRSAAAATGGRFLKTTRVNACDGFAYPDGFGAAPDNGNESDLREAVALAKILDKELGLSIINITAGNPYVNPHVNRPYDHGKYIPDEHPLEGVSRLMNSAAEIQRACPDMVVVGSGFSYLRHHSPALAAGALEEGFCSVAGFGRLAIAYPDFPADILTKGKLDANRCCMSCSKCAVLLRNQIPAGCVLRDDAYLPPYKRLMETASQ